MKVGELARNWAVGAPWGKNGRPTYRQDSKGRAQTEKAADPRCGRAFVRASRLLRRVAARHYSGGPCRCRPGELSLRQQAGAVCGGLQAACGIAESRVSGDAGGGAA